jgi:hypothetical protein
MNVYAWWDLRDHGWHAKGQGWALPLGCRAYTSPHLASPAPPAALLSKKQEEGGALRRRRLLGGRAAGSGDGRPANDRGMRTARARSYLAGRWWCSRGYCASLTTSRSWAPSLGTKLRTWWRGTLPRRCGARLPLSCPEESLWVFGMFERPGAAWAQPYHWAGAAAYRY